jgi:hypothetical protein
MSSQKRVFTQFSKGSPVSTSTVVDDRAMGIARSRAVLSTKEDFRREIKTLWETASDLFLTIGEYLLQAKATLKHGEYQDLISRELPFGYQVAHKLKAVAEKVKEGVIPADRLPKSYTTAYLLASMKDDELQKAEQRGLIQADVTRSAIKSFLKEVREADTSARKQARLEYRKLIRQRKAIADRIAALEAKYGDDLILGKDLNDDDDDDGPIIEGTAVEIEEAI